MSSSNNFELDCLKASDLLKSAHYVVVFTGAGISTPSGIPDFWSAGTGLWSRFDPMEVASLTAFHQHPTRFYNWFRPLMHTAYFATPNAAHIALAELETRQLIQSIITQNIDGLHQKAGSKKVIEIHGSMKTFTCPNCHHSYPGNIIADIIFNKHIPRCTCCNSIIKPDVILYEEELVEDTWLKAKQEIQTADLVWVIGSSLEVFPANLLPSEAASRGAKLLINTYSSTLMDEQADMLLPYAVDLTVPKLAGLMK